MRELTGYREAVAKGEPEAIYDELYRGPVRDPELGVVIVGTYGPARQILDTRRGDFSNAATQVPLYVPEDDVMQDLGEIFQTQGLATVDSTAQGLAMLDGGPHRERRRRARSAFSTVPSGNENMTRLVNQALAGLDEKRSEAGGRVDVVKNFIEPLALCDFQQRTGISNDLAEDLGSLLKGQVELLWGFPAPEQQRQLIRDLRHVWRICLEAVRRNRSDMQGGTHEPNVITGYLGTTAELARADQLDIYGHINAGYISNVHTLSNIVVRGLMEPGLWRQLHDNPGQVSGFVNKALDRYSGVHGWFKLAAAEAGVEVAGEHMRCGSRFLVMLNAANQAPDRQECEPSLTFSHGPHLCLGKNFAAQLLHSAMRGLVEKYPDALLAGKPKPWANFAFNGYPEAEIILSA